VRAAQTGFGGHEFQDAEIMCEIKKDEMAK
jgi:hypothetical protein